MPWAERRDAERSAGDYRRTGRPGDERRRRAAAITIQTMWRGWWTRRCVCDGAVFSFNAILADIDGTVDHAWSWPAVVQAQPQPMPEPEPEPEPQPEPESRAPLAIASPRPAPVAAMELPHEELSPPRPLGKNRSECSASSADRMPPRSAPSSPPEGPAAECGAGVQQAGHGAAPVKVGAALCQGDDEEEQERARGSALDTLPVDVGSMTDAQRRELAETLESELRWTEGALRSRVAHLVSTSPTRNPAPTTPG